LKGSTEGAIVTVAGSNVTAVGIGVSGLLGEEAGLQAGNTSNISNNNMGLYKFAIASDYNPKNITGLLSAELEWLEHRPHSFVHC
jgi:hypothetical protein